MNPITAKRRQRRGRAGALAGVLAATIGLSTAILFGSCRPADSAEETALTALSLAAKVPPGVPVDQHLTALANGVTFPATRVQPFDTFIKSIEAVSGGTSGYPFFLVVNVDPAKIASYSVKTTDPYWLQYYMKMWYAGKHARTYGPKPLADPYTVYYMDQFFSPNGSYKNSPAVFNAGSYSWKFSAQKNNRGTYTSPIWYYRPNYFPSYFAANSGRKYVPMGTSDDGVKENTTYFWSYTSSTSYNTAYLYYRFRIYTRENTTSLGTATTMERVITAGQVAENGWAILPMSGTEMNVTLNGTSVPVMSSVWVIVKPYNKNLYFNQNVAGQPYFHIATVGDSTMKKVLWQGAVATTLNAATNALFNNYINYTIAGLNTATFGPNYNVASVSFGGTSTPDYNQAGNAFVVTGTGSPGAVQTTMYPIPAANLAAYVQTYFNFGVNGSNNSLKDAGNTFGELSARLGGRPIVMIYMPQNMRYVGAQQTNVNNALATINAAANASNRLYGVFHSFADHIGLGALKNNPYITLNLVNPAQVLTSQFYSNITTSVAPITLLVGAQDKVTMNFGGGQGAINACVANSACTYSWLTSGHSMTGMLDAGASTKMRLGLPPGW